MELVAVIHGGLFVAANDITSTASVSDLVGTATAVVAVAVLYGVIGVALGVAVADPTVAVGSALAWLGIVEGVVPVVLRRPWLFRWMPSGAANALLGVADRAPDLLAPAAGFGLLVALTGGLAVVATGVFVAKDVDVS